MAGGTLARWEIVCRCGATEARVAGSERGAANQLHNAGWRAGGDQWLCPACAAARYRQLGSTLRPPSEPARLTGPQLRTTPRATSAPKPKPPPKPKPLRWLPSTIKRAERTLLADSNADAAALAREQS
jgi:hypothetical protein